MPASMLAVRRLFLRALALVYLVAFASLGVQVQGLIGSKGILPVTELLSDVRATTGAERYWLLPTLVARAHRDPEVRRAAFFWLGESEDPRALDFLAEVLRR
jgi:hypothetical protein